MAAYYVYSGATGANDGSNWANAFITLGGGLLAAAAEGTVFVAHDHAEASPVSLTLTAGGTDLVVPKVICVNRLGSVPPVSADRRATAQISTTGDSNLSLIGMVHYDGILFTAGNAAGATQLTLLGGSSATWMRLDNCWLRLGSTGGGSLQLGAGNGSLIDLNNTAMSFSGVSQTAYVGCVLRWRNTPNALIGPAVPNILFYAVAGTNADIELIGVDLSAVGSGKTMLGTGPTSVVKTKLSDCKLNASVSGTVPTNPAAQTNAVRSGATGINYAVYRMSMNGVLNQETTVVHSGGASDGTTPIAWRIDTNANSSTAMPFEAPPIAIWNEVTGRPITLTIQGIWGSASLPTNADIWVEAEYSGDTVSTQTQSSLVSDAAPSILPDGPSQQSAGSGSWGGSTTKFKLDVTFTPQQKGFVTAWVRAGKPGSTFYIDPTIRLT